MLYIQGGELDAGHRWSLRYIYSARGKVSVRAHALQLAALCQFSFNPMHTMPQHGPLAELPVNRQVNYELSPGFKNRVCGRALIGQSNAEIAGIEQLPLSTVNNAVKQISLCNTVQNKARSGRPFKHSA